MLHGIASSAVGTSSPAQGGRKGDGTLDMADGMDAPGDAGDPGDVGDGGDAGDPGDAGDRADAEANTGAGAGAGADADGGVSSGTRTDEQVFAGVHIGSEHDVFQRPRTTGFHLVEDLIDDTKVLSRLEAARMVKVAHLYHCEDMRPKTASRAACDAAEAGRRRLRNLRREDLTVAEVKINLQLSEAEARRLVSTALALTTWFPAALIAMAEGEIDRARAEVIVKHAIPLADHLYDLALRAGLSPDEAEEMVAPVMSDLEQHLLKRAGRQSPDLLRDSVKRRVHRLAPDFSEQRMRENLAARRVSLRPNPGEDTADLTARLGAAEATGSTPSWTGMRGRPSCRGVSGVCMS